MSVDDYLASIHLALVESPIVANYVVVRQRATSQSGHLRVRAELTNGDFLEMAEFFRLTSKGIQTIDYRHQWMDHTHSILYKRWDSTPHYPNLLNSPHHYHEKSEENVFPSQIISIFDVLKIINDEIG